MKAGKKEKVLLLEHAESCLASLRDEGHQVVHRRLPFDPDIERKREGRRDDEEAGLPPSEEWDIAVAYLRDLGWARWETPERRYALSGFIPDDISRGTINALLQEVSDGKSLVAFYGPRCEPIFSRAIEKEHRLSERVENFAFESYRDAVSVAPGQDEKFHENAAEHRRKVEEEETEERRLCAFNVPGVEIERRDVNSRDDLEPQRGLECLGPALFRDGAPCAPKFPLEVCFRLEGDAALPLWQVKNQVRLKVGLLHKHGAGAILLLPEAQNMEQAVRVVVENIYPKLRDLDRGQLGRDAGDGRHADTNACRLTWREEVPYYGGTPIQCRSQCRLVLARLCKRAHSSRELAKELTHAQDEEVKSAIANSVRPAISDLRSALRAAGAAWDEKLIAHRQDSYSLTLQKSLIDAPPKIPR